DVDVDGFLREIDRLSARGCGGDESHTRGDRRNSPQHHRENLPNSLPGTWIAALALVKSLANLNP
ncbi:MAG: hypothetical protein ACJ8DN_22795, partial [Microvirga sp.]